MIKIILDASIMTRIRKGIIACDDGGEFFFFPTPSDIRRISPVSRITRVVSTDEQATKRSRYGRFHGKNTSDVARQSAGPPRQLRANLFRLPGQFDD